MRRAVMLGVVYFLGVFALGFVLGALRELVMAPRFGRSAIVVVEAPLILLAAWLWCRWLLARSRLPAMLGPHLAMGALAFALLMAAEAMLAVAIAGRSVAGHFASYATTGGALELLPQAAFGLAPALQFLWSRS